MDRPTAVPGVSEETKLSRRRLLKIAAATGGTVAASTLIPNKWAKPVVDVGLLPAHAQMSIREAFWTGEPCNPPTQVDLSDVSVAGHTLQTEFYLCFDEDTVPLVDFVFSGGTEGFEGVWGLGPCNGAESLAALRVAPVPEGCHLFCDRWCVYFDQREKVTINLYECPTTVKFSGVGPIPEDCKLIASITLSKPD